MAAHHHEETGYLHNLTPEQEHALKQAREKYQAWLREEKLEDYDVLWRTSWNEPETQDYLLLRFLRARGFNVDVAMKLLFDCIIWRREFQGIGVDNIKEETIQNELRAGKSFSYGVDKQGHPVCYIMIHLHKKGAIPIDETQRYCLYDIERFRKKMKAPMETVTAVFDMSKFGMANMDYQFVKFLIDIFAVRYPESLHAAYIVDAPWLFNACWKVIKPWVDPRTVTKIHFASRKDLLQWIAKDELIQEMGGDSDYKYSYTPQPSIE